MAVELTEKLLSQAGGWEVMKRARAYLAQEQVLSSHWADPLLRGVVRGDQVSFRASMVIKSGLDMENLCTCREAREWGKVCAHSVAVGLHWLHAQNSPPEPAPRADGAPAATRPVMARAPAGVRLDPSGAAAALRLVFPPNLAEALGRGKIMLAPSARWSGGVVAFPSLPRNQGYAFSEQDGAIIGKLAEFVGGEIPALLQLNDRQLAELLPLLLHHEELTLGKGAGVVVTAEPWRLPLQAELLPDGQIRLRVRGGSQVPPMAGAWAWQAADHSFRPLSLPPALASVLQGPVLIPRTQVPAFLSRDFAPLAAAGLEANFQPADFSLAPQPPRCLLELRGGLAQLSALLQCAYGSRILTPGVTAADENVWLPDPADPRRYSARDAAAEQSALARLQRSGFSRPDAQGRMTLVGQNAVLNFFAREFPRLEREWAVTLEERLEQSATRNLERIAPRLEITPSGIQWFDLGVVFASAGGQTFSPAEIQRLLLSGQSHTRLRNGKFAVIDTGAVEELQEVLLDCAPRQHAQGYRIGSAQAGFLDATLRQHADWRVTAPAQWRERAARQGGEVGLDCPPLGDLAGVLRPYQKHGVAWLEFLRENQFGGILADEMGLGKTLQTLAFLRYVRERQPGGPPMLIVCPTSLVFNWQAEAARFTPSFKVLALHGSARHDRFPEISRHDLVITSYTLVRRDAEWYRALEFDTVVLDEAQHIKNRRTQNAQAVKAVRSSHRLVLTGTPLENSVLDLWSIFDFLMPGYLGTAQDFRDRYEVPITREKKPEAQARLARRLRPFLLRRLKKEVAPDLPERLEQVAFCELTVEQRQVYQQFLEATRKEVLDHAGGPDQGRQRMLVLSALLRLRQVCCDLRLLKKDEDARESQTAPENGGKLELFSELLQEAIDGGHRVLVFSQFVTMLGLLRKKLAEDEIEYCYLDGATTNRGEVVQRFQTNPTIPVFLISLKAGGVGLNLTGADTVIHFDPWWNPAVEDQATDRAHRIGQTRVVTSYKLIARDTVEEKILSLQNRKREIIRATIGEEEFAASLSWAEIQELLG